MDNLRNPGSGSQGENPKKRPTGKILRSPFDDIRKTDIDPEHGEFEYWSARELMPHLGYDRWDTFSDALERAKISCKNSGYHANDHFKGCWILAPRGNKGATQQIEDFQLTRLACYLVALCGDPRKRQIAAAQNYFVIQTRRAETELPPPVPSAPTPPVAYRPYSERLSRSMRDHRRYIAGNLPAGSFSILSATVPDVLVIEDVLIDHLLPLLPGDLPDGSIGRRYKQHRRDLGMPEPTLEAPLFLPDRQITVPVAVYEATENALFFGWLYKVYYPTWLPEYWGGKFTSCPAVVKDSAADNACLSITNQPATIPMASRQAIAAAGGIVRAPAGVLNRGKPPQRPAIGG